MKQVKFVGLSVALVVFGALGAASANEEQHYSHHLCRAENAENLDAGQNFSTVTGADEVYCPILRLSSTSEYSDVDLVTSLGVTQGEVSIRQLDDDGDAGVSIPAEAPTIVGARFVHDFDPFVPITNGSIFIRIEGQAGNQIFLYSLVDSTFTF
jgi:hypothetical protein